MSNTETLAALLAVAKTDETTAALVAITKTSATPTDALVNAWTRYNNLTDASGRGLLAALRITPEQLSAAVVTARRATRLARRTT